MHSVKEIILLQIIPTFYIYEYITHRQMYLLRGISKPLKRKLASRCKEEKKFSVSRF